MVAPSEAIPIDCSVMATEESGAVTLLVQQDATGGVSSGLRSVQLDGRALQADSTGLGAVFFEYHTALAGFGGKHILRLVDARGNQLEDSFSLTLFRLTGTLEELPRTGVDLPLEGLKDGMPVLVSLVDNAFETDDINSIDTVRKGRITLGADRLRTLSPGPAVLQLTSLHHRPLAGNKKAGRLRLEYSIQRETLIR